MTLKNKIKQQIIEILTQFEDRVLTGFRPFEEFKMLTEGDLQWTVTTPDGEDSNIILLSGINQECIDAFSELKNEKIIDFKPCDPLIAIAEGDVYKLPIPQSIKKYKLPRWLPTLVIRGENWEK